MRATGNGDDGVDDVRGNDRTVRVGADDGLVDDFLYSDDKTTTGECSFCLDPEHPPGLNVSVHVRALGVDDREVGVEGGDDVDAGPAVWIGHGFDPGILRRQVAAPV